MGYLLLEHHLGVVHYRSGSISVLVFENQSIVNVKTSMALDAYNQQSAELFGCQIKSRLTLHSITATILNERPAAPRTARISKTSTPSNFRRTHQNLAPLSNNVSIVSPSGNSSTPGTKTLSLAISSNT